MPSRIDDKTLVPLGVVAALFMIGIGVAVTGTFWVSMVNQRLSRIEDKLGIAKREPSSIVTAAEAGTNH